jgi:hypothetical protein
MEPGVIIATRFYQQMRSHVNRQVRLKSGEAVSAKVQSRETVFWSRGAVASLREISDDFINAHCITTTRRTTCAHHALATTDMPTVAPFCICNYCIVQQASMVGEGTLNHVGRLTSDASVGDSDPVNRSAQLPPPAWSNGFQVCLAR